MPHLWLVGCWKSLFLLEHHEPFPIFIFTSEDQHCFCLDNKRCYQSKKELCLHRRRNRSTWKPKPSRLSSLSWQKKREGRRRKPSNQKSECKGHKHGEEHQRRWSEFRKTAVYAREGQESFPILGFISLGFQIGNFPFLILITVLNLRFSE